MYIEIFGKAVAAAHRNDPEGGEGTIAVKFKKAIEDMVVGPVASYRDYSIVLLRSEILSDLERVFMIARLKDVAADIFRLQLRDSLPKIIGVIFGIRRRLDD